MWLWDGPASPESARQNSDLHHQKNLSEEVLMRTRTRTSCCSSTGACQSSSFGSSGRKERTLDRRRPGSPEVILKSLESWDIWTFTDCHPLLLHKSSCCHLHHPIITRLFGCSWPLWIWQIIFHCVLSSHQPANLSLGGILVNVVPRCYGQSQPQPPDRHSRLSGWWVQVLVFSVVRTTNSPDVLEKRNGPKIQSRVANGHSREQTCSAAELLMTSTDCLLWQKLQQKRSAASSRPAPL